jgi:hypothetical protein
MDGEWLPPQAPGDPPPPADQPQRPPPPPAPAPPPAAPPQPPPGYQPQPPPGYPPQPVYPPPGYSSGGFPSQPYPPPVYAPQPPNNDAVVGFTCAVIGGALLFFSAGLSTIVSLTLGIVAIPYSRKGKRAIAEGRTAKHKDLANAGYVIGIVVTVLSILATIGWVLLLALVDWDEIDDSEDDPFDEDFQFQVVLRVLAAAARLLG